MKALVLLSLIALSFGAITHLEIAEADLLHDFTDQKYGDPVEDFVEFLGQIINQPDFVSNLETVWNETLAGKRNVTNFNNLIQESKRILGENATVLLQDYLQLTYYEYSNTSRIPAAVQKTFSDLSQFLFPGSDSLNSFLRDTFYTGMYWINDGSLDLNDGQKIIRDILESFSINTSAYQTEIQEVVQVIYNHYLAPPKYVGVDVTQGQASGGIVTTVKPSGGYVNIPSYSTTGFQEELVPPSNNDIIELIGHLVQIFNNSTSLENIVIQDTLEIWNQSISSQLNVTLVKKLIGDASNLLIEDFVGDEPVIQDAMQTLDDIMSLSTLNTSNLYKIFENIAESLLNTYGLNTSAFSASPVVSSAQILIQASLKLLGNTTGPESMISDTLEMISGIISSDHFNITDVIPIIEDAFELVGNDTEYGGIIKGLIEILNDIASGQEINVADLALDIEEAFSDIVFGNSSYFNNAVQDLILIIQGQTTTTNILNLALNVAQVLAEVTDYSGPIENGINIYEDLTSGNISYLNIVENGAELLGELTGRGDIVQDVLKVVNDVTSGIANPVSFLEDVVKVIEDITGYGSLGNIAEDVDLVEDSVQVLKILRSSDFSGANIQTIIEIGLAFFGKATNFADLTSDLIQAMEDITNEEGNFDLIAMDGANIAHDLVDLGVANQDQGNMKTIVEDTLQMVGMTNGEYYFLVTDFVNAYNNFTSGNITKELFIENMITLIEDLGESTNMDMADYDMHSAIANVFEIMNNYASGQFTTEELSEDIAIILADVLLAFGTDNLTVPVQNIVQVLRDYSAHDMQSLVEDAIDLLTQLGVISPDGFVLSKSIATSIAIDQYTAHSSQDNAMDNGEDALFY